MLATGETYRDLGGDFFTSRDPQRGPEGSSPSSNDLDTTSRSSRGPRQPERTFPVSSYGRVAALRDDERSDNPHVAGDAEPLPWCL